MRKWIVIAACLVLFPGVSSAASCPNFSRNLSLGSRGTDVVQLQQFLISQNLLSTGSATGYFGRLTQAAVQKWQCQKGIVCSGSPSTNGYGAVGPKTRAAIAVACKAGTVTPSDFNNPNPYATPASTTAATRPPGGIASPVGNVPPNSPLVPPSCTFNGQTITSGASLAAYKNSVASYGSSCISENRICTNGNLSGTFTALSCATSYPNIDVGQAITAFARKHPTEVKKRTQHITTGADIVDWVHNDAIVERYPLQTFNVWDQVIVTSIGDSTRPGWIHDWYKVTSSEIVLHGTYQKANQVFLTLEPGISMSRRSIQSEVDTAPLLSTVSVYSGLDKHLTETGKGVPTHLSFETIDVGGTIGRRWALVFNFRDNNPDMPDEHWYVDLGPTEGTFAPEYGFIAYKQNNAFKNSDNTSFETYGTLSPMEVHETDLGSFFTY